MVTYSVSVDVSKFAVASEAISSTARILAAAGFSESDIAALFQRAADDLSGQLSEDSESVVQDFEEPTSEYGLYDLFEEYENTPEKKALNRLEKRASAFQRSGSKEDLEGTFAVIEQALPLAAKATDWLVARCRESGIQVEPSKDEWLQCASDEEIDKEHSIVFLDDWQVNGDFQLRNIEYLARSYAHSGDLEAFSRLVTLIRTHKVLYGSQVMGEIERTADALESMAEFVAFVHRHSGEGEITQSTLFDDYIREHGFSGGTYLLEGWLETLTKRGEIQRYKRSNRWRIVV